MWKLKIFDDVEGMTQHTFDDADLAIEAFEIYQEAGCDVLLCIGDESLVSQFRSRYNCECK
jgi:hypothetical protein